jgi:ribonuclease Z
VLRATHAFISHAHMDHFCGFDTVVRYTLGREKVFRIVGPPGIADRVEGKLSGYTWNLVDAYSAAFELEVLEWGETGARLWLFPCRGGFLRVDAGAVNTPELSPGIRVVHTEPALRVLAAALDHKVPSLAYALEEPVHVNVVPEGLRRLGLEPGPWVRNLKGAVFQGSPPETPIPLPAGGTAPLGKFQQAGALLVSAGQKLAYLADFLGTGAEIDRAVELARGAHILYCEAAFLQEDVDRARDRYHLTAAQAGEIGRRAGVGELRIFHFSPKYRGREAELLAEAKDAFHGPVFLGP